MTTLEWALRYLEHGWKVLPIWSVDEHGRCRCGTPECKVGDIGKHPCAEFAPRGVHSASGDEATVRRWFATETYNIAIMTGKASGITVVDVDVNDGKKGAETWAALIEGHEEPHTLMAATGSGGMHVFFQYNAAIASKNNLLGPNVDVKNQPGYVLAAPSRHRSGGTYEWMNWGTVVAPWPAYFTPVLDAKPAGRPRKDDLRRQTFTIKEVEGMLAKIPADNRDWWRDFGVILGRTFDRSDEAWRVYTEWAAKDERQKGRGHDQTMHDMFYVTSHEPTERPLSIGTLVKIALEHGWVPKGGSVPVTDFVYVASGNNYLYRSTGAEWIAAGVDAVVASMNVDGKIIRASTWLKEHHAVTSLTCDPIIEGDLLPGFNCRAGTLVPALGAAVFNIYRRPTIELGDARKAAPWVEHTHRLMNKPGDADQLMNYLAHRVQHPGVKPRFALLIAGGQGVGKDTSVDMTVPSIGAWNVKSIDPDTLESPYTGYKACTLLRIHEASNLQDMSKWAFNEHMKTLIAGGGSDGCEINPKYGQMYTMRLYCGVILTTNNLLSGIFIPEDDRRYDVIDCATFDEMGLSDTIKRGKYFDTLYAWFFAGGDRHIAAFLHERDLSRWSPDHGQRKTLAHQMVINEGRTNDLWLLDILEELGSPEVVRGDWITNRAVANGEKTLDVTRKLSHAIGRAGYVKFNNPEATGNLGRWKVNGRSYSVYVRGTTKFSYKQVVDAIQQEKF